MIQKDSKPLAGVRRDPVKTFEGLEHHILAIAMFPDGERIATGSGDKAIRMWRVGGRKEMKEWVMEKIIGALAILKDGRRVVSSEGPELGGDEILSYQWQLWVRDAQTGRVMAGPLDGHTHQVLTLDVSPEGGILASGSHDCTVILWDTSTWQRKGDPLLCGAFVTCVQFSRSSSHLGVTTAEDIQIWDLDRRVCLAQFKGHAAYNKTWNKWLTWTRDGAHLFSAGAFNDPVISCWDTTTSKQAGDAWAGHHYDIFQIVLNPADTLLASASDDHTVRLWQVPTGTEVARYNHSHVILRVAFSVNGPFLYSGGEDKRISQRQIPVEVLAAARRAQKTEGGPSRSKPKNPKGINDVEIPGQRHNMPSGSRPQAAQAAFQSPADVNSSSSTREHEIKRFFSWMRSSLDKKEKKGVPRSRGTPEVVDVPLAPATYRDYVASEEDGRRPYVLFFCFLWCQKNEKQPDPAPQLYDADIMNNEQEKDPLDIPIPSARVRFAQEEDIELTPVYGKPEHRAHLVSVFGHVHCQTRQELRQDS